MCGCAPCVCVAHSTCTKQHPPSGPHPPTHQQTHSLSTPPHQVAAYVESVGARPLSSFRVALQAQCKGLLDAHHTRSMSQMQGLLEAEQWSAVDVPAGFQVCVAERVGAEGVVRCVKHQACVLVLSSAVRYSRRAVQGLTLSQPVWTALACMLVYHT